MSKITVKKVLKWGLISGTVFGIGYVLGNDNARKKLKNTGLSTLEKVKDRLGKKDKEVVLNDLPKHEPEKVREEPVSTMEKPKYFKGNYKNNINGNNNNQ